MDFIDNLTALTNNLEDISFTRYAKVTKINNDNTFECIEEETSVTHKSVVNGTKFDLSIDDIIVLGFVDNNIYNPIIVAGINIKKRSSGDFTDYYTKNETDNLLTDKLNTNLGVANKNVVTDENGNVSLEEKSGNNGFGSFYINEEGHLIAVIPSNVNPYKIIDGHLIYDTEAI